MKIIQKSVGQVTWRQIFNKFRLLNFSEFSQNYCETPIIRKYQGKVKVSSQTKKKIKNHFTIEIAKSGQINFDP